MIASCERPGDELGEDPPDDRGLSLDDDEPGGVLGVAVAVGAKATMRPAGRSPGAFDVADALGDPVPLELGDAGEYGPEQAACRGGCVDCLRDRDDVAVARREVPDHGEQVGGGATEAIEL